MQRCIKMDVKLSEVPPPPETSPSAPSASLFSDPKPPTYEEATDPTFMQRFQNFTQTPIPQWPGFHPAAEVSRVSRQMSRQMSRNSPQPQDETPGETDPENQNQENEEPLDCGLVFGMIFGALFVLSLIVVPISMIVVGAVYHGTCYYYTPYVMWLLVGGSTFFS